MKQWMDDALHTSHSIGHQLCTSLSNCWRVSGWPLALKNLISCSRQYIYVADWVYRNIAFRAWFRGFESWFKSHLIYLSIYNMLDLWWEGDDYPRTHLQICNINRVLNPNLDMTELPRLLHQKKLCLAARYTIICHTSHLYLFELTKNAVAWLADVTLSRPRHSFSFTRYHRPFDRLDEVRAILT